MDTAEREHALAAAPVKRSRRPRLGWGSVAAAIVPVLVVAGLIGWLVTGGTSSNMASLSGDAARRAVAAPAMPSATKAPVPGALIAQGADPLSHVFAHQQLGDLSKIIRDGSIVIEVPKDEFQKGFAAVTRIADTTGGFVLSSQTRGQRSGALTLRIPAKRFDQAMLALSQVGLVQATSVTGKDVTAEFVDLNARLQNAIDQRDALRALMAKATTIAETLTVQSHLQNVQLQIEQIQGQLHYIDDQVAESTIRVALHEKNAPHPTQQTTTVKNPSLGTAWDRAVQGFLNIIAAIVVGLGYLIPLGILALAVWLITLAVRRRRAAS
jgi:hypothetical protein